MNEKTTKAAKFNDDNATSNSVSEAVSGDKTGAILKSCCDAISASIINTDAPRSHGVTRRDRVLLMLESSLSLTDCCNRFGLKNWRKFITSATEPLAVASGLTPTSRRRPY